MILQPSTPRLTRNTASVREEVVCDDACKRDKKTTCTLRSDLCITASQPHSVRFEVAVTNPKYVADHTVYYLQGESAVRSAASEDFPVKAYCCFNFLYHIRVALYGIRRLRTRKNRYDSSRRRDFEHCCETFHFELFADSIKA